MTKNKTLLVFLPLVLWAVHGNAVTPETTNFPNNLDMKASYCLKALQLMDSYANQQKAANADPETAKLLDYLSAQNKKIVLHIKRYLVARGFFNPKNLDASTGLLVAGAQAQDDFQEFTSDVNQAMSCVPTCNQGTREEQKTCLGKCYDDHDSAASKKMRACNKIEPELPF